MMIRLASCVLWRAAANRSPFNNAALSKFTALGVQSISSNDAQKGDLGIYIYSVYI